MLFLSFIAAHLTEEKPEKRNFNICNGKRKTTLPYHVTRKERVRKEGTRPKQDLTACTSLSQVLGQTNPAIGDFMGFFLV